MIIQSITLAAALYMSGVSALKATEILMAKKGDATAEMVVASLLWGLFYFLTASNA